MAGQDTQEAQSTLNFPIRQNKKSELNDPLMITGLLLSLSSSVNNLVDTLRREIIKSR